MGLHGKFPQFLPVCGGRWRESLRGQRWARRRHFPALFIEPALRSRDEFAVLFCPAWGHFPAFQASDYRLGNLFALQSTPTPNTLRLASLPLVTRPMLPEFDEPLGHPAFQRFTLIGLSVRIWLLPRRGLGVIPFPSLPFPSIVTRVRYCRIFMRLYRTFMRYCYIGNVFKHFHFNPTYLYKSG